MRIQGRQDGRQLVVAGELFYEIIIAAISIERGFAHKAAAFDAPMLLGDGECVGSGHLLDLDAFNVLSVRDDEMRVESRAKEVGVEADLIAASCRVFDGCPAYGRESKPGMLRP